jgi:hypothetical protein
MSFPIGTVCASLMCYPMFKISHLEYYVNIKSVDFMPLTNFKIHTLHQSRYSLSFNNRCVCSIFSQVKMRICKRHIYAIVR